MGLQDDAGLSEGTERVTTGDLLAAVDDPAVTARTLEFWRHQGLLPKAQRTGQHGKRPEWTYPAEARDQLGALVQLRTKTKDPDLARVGLFFEGFPIETRLVRASIVAVLETALAAMVKEVDKHRSPGAAGDEANWEALEQIARVLAGKRGANAPPRYGRQRREDRERAMALAIGLVLGDEGSTARLEQDAPHVERMIGLDRGRRPRGGLPPWLDGPAGEGLEAFSHYGSLPALIETMRTATDDELTASRTLARIMLDGITAFTRIADSVAGSDNASGFGAIAVFRGEPMAAVWLLAFVIAAGRSSTLNEGLRAAVDSLSQHVLPVDARARELAALDPGELQNRLPELERLPFVEQVRIKRLIAQHRSEAIQQPTLPIKPAG